MKKWTAKEQKKLEGDFKFLYDNHGRYFVEPRPSDLIEVTNKMLDYDNDFLRRGGIKQWWKFVADVYQATEFTHNAMPLWTALLKNPNANQMMSVKDRNKFKKLPNEFEVYRGGVSDQHFSWTTDKAVAEWFMSRHNDFNEIFAEHNMKQEPLSKLWTKTVKKENCICYFGDMQESEVIVKFWELN